MLDRVIESLHKLSADSDYQPEFGQLDQAADHLELASIETVLAAKVTQAASFKFLKFL